MSGEIALWAARQDIKNHAAKMVLIALGDAFDDRTGMCFPSHEAIGDFVRRSESALKEAIRHLEAEGWIKREARFTESGRQTSSSYQIIFERGESFEAMVARRRKIRGEKQSRMEENSRRADEETGGGMPPPQKAEDRPSRGAEKSLPLTESILNKGAPAREGDKSALKEVGSVDWRNRLHLYRKRANWPLKWGPPLNAPGCLVPLHLVKEWNDTKGEAFKNAEAATPKAAKRTWLPRGNGASQRPGTSHD
jgi:hypothetical protein